MGGLIRLSLALMVGRKLEHKTVRLGHVHVVVGELNFDKKNASNG